MALFRKVLMFAAVAALALTTAFAVMAQEEEPASPREPAAQTQTQEEAQPAVKRHHRKPSHKVMEVQEALNKHGANLKVDGYMGKETRVALKAFQKENGLKATGRLNRETMEKLGIGKKTAESSESMQTPEPAPEQEAQPEPEQQPQEEPAPDESSSDDDDGGNF
jgi:peptidoglycan hydrolase-like protein with peptidoglycan-binding domain